MQVPISGGRPFYWGITKPNVLGDAKASRVDMSLTASTLLSIRMNFRTARAAASPVVPLPSLPLGLPSELLLRRPDIRAADLLHQQALAAGARRFIDRGLDLGLGIGRLADEAAVRQLAVRAGRREQRRQPSVPWSPAAPCPARPP